MKEFKEYISEKLSINKDTKFKLGEEDIWYGDVDDLKDMPKEFYENRKLKRKPDKNRPWYAVFRYLKFIGKARPEQIRADVWPGKTSQQAELFVGLREYGVIHTIKTGSDKGYYVPNDYEEFHLPKFNTLNTLW